MFGDGGFEEVGEAGAEFGVDVGVPLVKPGEEVFEAGEEGEEAFGRLSFVLRAWK